MTDKKLPPKALRALRIVRSMRLHRMPVRVQIVELRGKSGECRRFRKHCRIRIGRSDLRLPHWVTRNTIIHEWAHACGPWRKVEHGGEWGSYYARLYTEVLKRRK